MKVEHEDLGGLKHRISVTVDKEGFDKERRKLARRYATEVRVPGFRPGHAPLDFVIKSIGPKLEYEVRENLISETFAGAIDQFELKPSTEPKFDLVNDDVDSISYTAEIEVFPEVAVKDYMEIEVTAPFEAEVTEASVDERIDGLLASLSRFEEKAADSVVDENDMVEAAVALFNAETGEEYKGSQTSRIMAGTDDEPVAGIGRQILGMKVGEEKSVEAPIGTIAAKGLKLDPQAIGKVRAVVKINAIRFRKRPDLDADFVKKHADVETVEEFRALLHKQLEEQRASRIKDATEEAILSKICDNNPFEIGERTVERLAEMAEKEARDRVLQQIPEEKRAELAKNFDLGVPREQSLIEARRNLTRSIVLEAVADKEGIEVTEADIEEKLQETADAYGMPLPKIKAIFGEERLDQLARQLRVGKTMDLLTRYAVVKPAAEGDVEDLAKADEKPAKKAARKATAKKAEGETEAAAEPTAEGDEETSAKADDKPAKKAAKPKKAAARTEE